MSEALFNPLLPEYLADPHPFLHRLRREDPVHYAKLFDVWVLTRYDDVLEALRDARFAADVRRWNGYERFFRRPGVASDSPLERMYSRWMLQLDGKDHHRLRTLVNNAFTPRMVERMRPFIQSAVDRLLGRFAPGEAFDFVTEVAYPLPIVVSSAMLGTPEADYDRIKEWCTRLLPSFTPAMSLSALQDVNRTLEEFSAYFRELARQRQASPRDDLLTALINAREQEDRLSEDELLATCILLSFAGHASTVQGLCNTMLELGRHPGTCEDLRREPARVAGAVEESLRLHAPLQLIYRATTEEVPMRGKVIPRGAMVFLSILAANRDPERFAEPDRFDVARTSNRHLAFGYAHHFCVGNALARLELQVMVQAVLGRYRRIEVDEAGMRREPSLIFRGLTHMPVTLN